MTTCSFTDWLTAVEVCLGLLLTVEIVGTCMGLSVESEGVDLGRLGRSGGGADVTGESEIVMTS